MLLAGNCNQSLRKKRGGMGVRMIAGWDRIDLEWFTHLPVYWSLWVSSMLEAVLSYLLFLTTAQRSNPVVWKAGLESNLPEGHSESFPSQPLGLSLSSMTTTQLLEIVRELKDRVGRYLDVTAYLLEHLKCQRSSRLSLGSSHAKTLETILDLALF